jgi:hypothetical protein
MKHVYPSILSFFLVLAAPALSGGFFNAGYEWRWTNGLGVLLGGGIAHLTSVHATDGINTVETRGGTFPNLEVGVRYLFL